MGASAAILSAFLAPGAVTYQVGTLVLLLAAIMASSFQESVMPVTSLLTASALVQAANVALIGSGTGLFGLGKRL